MPWDSIDKWRDEDYDSVTGQGSVDGPVTSGALRADKRPLTEPVRRYCYAQCRDPWFNECADCWRSGGNPPLSPEIGSENWHRLNGPEERDKA